jgi:hypothetical protein
MALQQTLQTKRSQRRRIQHRPAQTHSGFNLVDVLAAGTTRPTKQPVEFRRRNRQAGIDLQILHAAASNKAIVHILPASHQEHHFRGVGQQHMGLLIQSRSVTQNLQPLRLVIAEHHLTIAKDISVLHDNQDH